MHERTADEWDALAEHALEAEAQFSAEQKETVEWFVLSGENDRRVARVPEWQRRAAIHNGTVFAPAIVAGNEMTVFLCAGYDGTPCLQHEGHPFFPVDWMAREFPKAREICEKIKRRITQFAADDPPPLCD